MIAIKSGLELLLAEDLTNVHEIRICSDSQSSIVRLSQGPPKQNDHVSDDTWQHLIHLSGRNIHITFQWVPGHCGVDGNEKVDAIANEGTENTKKIARLTMPQ